eukprot:1393172-Pyramimonas_sp.AAC.1
MLHDGVLRQLERDAGRFHKVPCRICYDVVSSQLRSSRYTHYGKGCVKSLVCGAVWANERAPDLGCALPSAQCPLGCGERGTIFH